MKNLITQFQKGVSLKDQKIAKEERRDPWESRKSTYHKVDGVSPWRRIKRICDAYIGKSFDKAFSEYCSQVPIYQQKFFLEEFEKGKRWRSDYWTYYYVDKQGNIQKHIGEYYKKKEPIYYYSDDYKSEKRHKVTGATYPADWFTRNKKNFKEDDYELVVTQGYFIKFSSKKDPEYIRLTTDQRKRRKAAQRVAEKEKAAKDYSFISKSEEERKKEKERNKLKIEVKGFDYVTSFRDAGVNPDVIATLQGFAK